MAASRRHTLAHRLTSLALGLSLLAGPPAMMLRHSVAAGAAMSHAMAMGHHAPAGHDQGGHRHDPLAPCCDLCAVGCVSAPLLGSAAVPLPALAATAAPHPFPAGRSALPSPLSRLLPPAVGPPVRI